MEMVNTGKKAHPEPYQKKKEKDKHTNSIIQIDSLSDISDIQINRQEMDGRTNLASPQYITTNFKYLKSRPSGLKL